MGKVGKRLIDGLRGFADVLSRGEEPGAHFKITHREKTMTASELRAMVEQWPLGARPTGLHYEVDSGVSVYADDNGLSLCLTHAIAIHEAAGIKWLCEGPTLPVRIYTVGADSWWAVDFDSVRPGQFQAPTLIEALHAAIIATKENNHAE